MSLQLLVTLCFSLAFFGLFVEQFIELRGDVTKIGWEVFKQGIRCLVADL